MGNVGAGEGSETERNTNIVCKHCQTVKLRTENVVGDDIFKISVFSSHFSFVISFDSLFNLGAAAFSAAKWPSVPDAPCLSCTFLHSLASPGAGPFQDTKRFPDCLAEGVEVPPLWTALGG